MLCLKCPRCGHEYEQAASASCPRCGIAPSSAAPADAFRTVGAEPLLAASPVLSATHVTRSQMDAGLDTVAPSRAAAPMSAYSFLSPPDEPNELGWLAHYRVVKLLGQGGMGMVFKAIDTQLMRTVALKVMKGDIAADESARQRFLREARVTASVKSDHVVVIHQVGQHSDVPFLAMEFLQGEPLDRWLSQKGRPTLEETLRIGLEIAHGLAAAHALDLIHRDIKPGNIWLESRRGDRETRRQGDKESANKATPCLPVSLSPCLDFRVKILDFGLARVACDNTQLTHTGIVVGTPAYMSPEQAEGIEVDSRCDLFSLGCVLYELATGTRPFGGANTMSVLLAVATKDPVPPQQLNPDLPPALADLILHLLAKKPQDRPSSAQEVAAALQAIGDEFGAFNRTPASGFNRSQFRSTISVKPAAPRFPFALALAVAGSLLALGLAILLIVSMARARDDDHGQNAGDKAAAVLPEIVLGMSGVLNGPAKELGREMEIGIDTCLAEVNDHGGIHGRKLRLVSLDDAYEPQAALLNMKELHHKHKVFAVIGNIGTPTAELTVPYALENKILFYGAFTGAKFLRKSPPDRYVFNFRASYEEETAKIVEYLIKIRKVKPHEIAVFDQNDGFGDAGFSGVVKELRKYNRDPDDIVRVRYQRNTKQVKDAADVILKKPEIKAVVMVGTYKPVTEFIRQLKDAKRDLIFTNVSFVGSDALAEDLRELGPSYVEGVIVTQVVPPIDSGATIVLKYHEQRKKHYPNERASFGSLEGYISTSLFVEGLRRAGADPTTERMIDALESIHDFDMGLGTPLSFGASEHQASHKVWGTMLDKAGSFRLLELAD